MKERKNEQTHADRRRTKRRLLWACGAVILALLCFALGWILRWLALGSNARRLLWAVDTAKDHFYRDVDEDELYGSLYDALTPALDPYSEFFTAEEYRLETLRGEGETVGIGVSVWRASETPRIYSVSGNSPAERAGIRSGMTVFAYGADELVSGSREEFLAFTRAQSGKFRIKCGFDEAHAEIYTVAPETYRISYCRYRDAEISCRFDPETMEQAEIEAGSAEIPENAAYIRIDEFHGTAAEEFEACLNLMKQRKKTDLILDLRSNGGGYLSVFLEIASHLVKNAEGNHPLLATARYRDGSQKRYFAPKNDYGKYFSDDARIYLLADENTASASECLIGAMVSYGTLSYSDIFLREENGSARTYGKGIMQTTFTDTSGNAMKLTVAEIFWPNGRSIHGVGVNLSDGAQGVQAPLLPGEEDAFLSKAVRAISGETA